MSNTEDPVVPPMPAQTSTRPRPRIFISHKVLDRQLVTYFKEQLLELGLRETEIYLSEETRPGTDWNQDILSKIKQSDTLVFIYTDPSYDWDWCLFECGFFAGLDSKSGQKRSLVCINSGIGRPSPLNLWQDISSSDALEIFLRDIAERVNSPLVQQHTAFLDFVKQFWTSIYRRLPLKDPSSREAFKQRRLAIIVPPEEMKRIKEGKESQLTDSMKVEISDGSRSIFPNAPLEAGWNQFLTALRDQPLQLKWMRSLPIMIRMLNGVRTESPMMPLVRDGLTPEIAYRPSIAQRDVYGDDTVRYTVVFIRTPESTVASTDPVDRAYVWLMLARNFRETVIDLYKKKLKHAAEPKDLRFWAEDLQGQIALTRIDAVSRGMDMETDMALFCSVTKDTILKLRKQWEDSDKQFAELQIWIEGLAYHPNPPPDTLSSVGERAGAALHKMAVINAEFTLHIAAAYLGYVTRPPD